LKIQEWLESLDSVLESRRAGSGAGILERLRAHATVNGIDLPFTANNAVCEHDSGAAGNRYFPVTSKLERRIKSLIRWNALAMVVRAKQGGANIGGHISTYASAATLYEVGVQPLFPRKKRKL